MDTGRSKSGLGGLTTLAPPHIPGAPLIKERCDVTVKSLRSRSRSGVRAPGDGFCRSFALGFEEYDWATIGRRTS